MQIIELLNVPDDKEFYFTEEHLEESDITPDNDETYQLWKDNKDKFLEKAKNQL